jgi:DNA-binding NarL/FixJ family response regulator
MIKVLVVDDHAIVRQGLIKILDDVHGIEVGGEAANGIEALNCLRIEHFDVVLLDISMPERNGFDTMKQIIERGNGTRILILSSYPEEQFAVRMMKAGASGYITKDSAPDVLVDAIHKIASGKKHISSKLAEMLLDDCTLDSSKPFHERLSNREYQVLRLLGSGKKVSDIAKALSISVKTVSTYRGFILEKMKLKNNADITYYVIENGLMERYKLN